ncbi:MAG: InlB B-repeat-containing protein [Eubacteriales bacterium]|nr:InlB B-repeat-containing protein [Eubacteriales bacterium]
MKKKLLAAVLAMAMLTGCGANSKTTDSVSTSDGWIITFNPNDRDQEITQVEVADGEKLEEPAVPSRTDYVFTGWYLNKRASGEPFDFDTEITDDLFLYAGWTSTKVDVTFDPNYEEGKAETLRVDGGEPIAEDEIPDVPERENYEFLGWYQDAAGTEPFDFTKILTKNTTIYGKWNQLRATVSFDLGYFGGGEAPETQVLDLTKGEKAAEPETPVRGETGDYQFEGWFVEKAEEPYDFSAEVTGDMNLTAKWTMLKASVTYDLNAEDMENPVEKVEVGEKAVEFDQIERTGYDLIAWYFDKDCTASADLASLTITDDLTVYGAWEAQPRTITYHYNYEGAPADVTVESVYDAITEEPEDPVREDGEFIGWFLDAEQTEPFVFGEKLTDNVNLYAGWAGSEEETEETAESGEADKKSKTNTLTFYVNDGTDTVYETEEVKRNKYSAMRNAVTYPEREGYTAVGWYTTEDCEEGTEFNFNARITASADLYAKWVKEYVFEAELTQLTDIPIGDTGKTEDKLGFGESSNPKGLYLIEWDSYDAGASNGYYVSYLYNPGTYLEFCITAEEDVEDASLVLRLTPELHDMYFLTGGPDGTAAEKHGYKIYVNPEYSYNSVTNKEILETYDQVYDLDYDLTGAVTKDEDPNYTRKRPFEDYLITEKLSLHAGENIIRLVTDNTHDYGGSMHAAAPMVDCIKIYTDAEIDWTEGCEYTENLDGIDVRWPEKTN